MLNFLKAILAFFTELFTTTYHTRTAEPTTVTPNRDPYWGEVGLNDRDWDARTNWEEFERMYRECSEGVKRRPVLTGKELGFAEGLDGYKDLAKRSYTAAELHEVIVNCLRTADEEDVRNLIPTVPERYFDLPLDLDRLEDLYETLCILMENPGWEGENPSECWPRKITTTVDKD